MSTACTTDLLILRGTTFRKVVRWEAATFLAKEITAMSKAGIVRIVTPGPHGIPDGWRVAVVDAKGMTELNAVENPPRARDMRVATVVSATEVEFNEISSAAFRPYAGGGFLKWYAPRDLTGYTARMEIRDAAGQVLTTLTTENAGIVLDSAEHMIDLLLSAAATAVLALGDCTFDLEMISSTGEVTFILSGPVRVVDSIAP